MKVVTIVGTRPELIKLSRVIALLDLHTHHVLIHTGQNYDYELNEIFFDDLKIRKKTTDEESYQTELETFREQIDVSDQAILDALGKRMKVAESIGQLKKENNVAVLQNKRWNEILDTMQAEGSERGLSEDFITRIFKAIHQESINHQEKVING